MFRKVERAAKRSRRLSTDSEGQEEEYDWSDRPQRAETAGRPSTRGRAGSGTNMSRGRRNVGSSQPEPLAKVSRLPSSSPSSHQSLHLTVKLPSSKLRQATRMAPPARSSGPSISLNSRDQFVGGEIIEGKRSRNVKKSYVLESDSEDEEDEEMEDVADDDDAEGESIEEEEEEEEEDEEEDDDDEMADQDAEGGEEDADADVDVDVEIPPPPPTIKISRAGKGKKPTILVKPTGKSDGKTVEAKESAEASDDEELSELESEMEEEEEGMQLGGEEDAEGEEEEEDVEEVEEEEEEDDELDSDDETPAGGSRASTPDLTKLTKRQRARLEEGGSGHLLALPDEVQVKKHLTAEEHAMRRAEMARRRKNLSEKRNEEEKMETINKLLKKQAPKTNSRRSAFNGSGGADAGHDEDSPKANPVFVRWASSKDGNRIGVPEEWLGAPVGAIFTGLEGIKTEN